MPVLNYKQSVLKIWKNQSDTMRRLPASRQTAHMLSAQVLMLGIGDAMVKFVSAPSYETGFYFAETYDTLNSLRINVDKCNYNNIIR